MLEADINLSVARNYIVGSLVPEIRAMQQRSFAEHLKARAEGRNSSIGVRSKNNRTFETTNEDDISVDQVIQLRLRGIFPSIPYLSEDSPDQSLRNLSPDELRQKPAMWVVDARDGSGRFENYDPEFSTSIALVERGKVVLGVLHKPIDNTTWWAQEDEEGAYMNGERIFVSDTDTLRASMLGLPYSWDLDDRADNIKFLLHLSSKVHQPGMNYASSALDIVQVADGRRAGFFGRGLKPWDFAADLIILEKAGGRSSDYNGEPVDPFKNDLLLTNGKIHDELLEEVREFEEAKGNKMKNPRQSLHDILLMPAHMIGERLQPLVEVTKPARQAAHVAMAVPAFILSMLGAMRRQ